jgi:hypothetical protein
MMPAAKSYSSDEEKIRQMSSGGGGVGCGWRIRAISLAAEERKKSKEKRQL